MAVVGTERVMDVPVPTQSCRSRLRQVLNAIETGDVTPDAVLSTVEESRCTVGHDLAWADLTTRYVTVQDGLLQVTREGRNWLLDHGAPSPDWHTFAGAAPALRAWQAEALKRGVTTADTASSRQ